MKSPDPYHPWSVSDIASEAKQRDWVVIVNKVALLDEAMQKVNAIRKLSTILSNNNVARCNMPLRCVTSLIPRNNDSVINNSSKDVSSRLRSAVCYYHSSFINMKGKGNRHHQMIVALIHQSIFLI